MVALPDSPAKTRNIEFLAALKAAVQRPALETKDDTQEESCVPENVFLVGVRVQPERKRTRGKDNVGKLSFLF